MGINLLTFTIIILGLYKFNMNSLEMHLFSIGILTKVLSNVTWFLTAVSGRSGLIAGVFILASVVLFLIRTYEQKLNFKRIKTFHKLTVFSFLMFVPFIFYKLADMIYYVSVYMLALPFIPWFTDDINYSIREFLGLFL